MRNSHRPYRHQVRSAARYYMRTGGSWGKALQKRCTRCGMKRGKFRTGAFAIHPERIPNAQ